MAKQINKRVHIHHIGTVVVLVINEPTTVMKESATAKSDILTTPFVNSAFGIHIIKSDISYLFRLFFPKCNVWKRKKMLVMYLKKLEIVIS